MLPILQIGPLALPVPAFSLLMAMWLGLALSEKFAPKRNFSTEALYDLAFIGLATGLIGARVGYIFQYPNAFIQSPASLISLNRGLSDPFAGVAVGLIAMLVYGQRAKLPFWNTLDVLTPLFAMIAVGFAVAHIASGEAFGAETTLPWGINLWGATRHPSQFYELVVALAILALLSVWTKKPDLPTGTLFLAFAALTAGSRLFLEAFRGDSTVIFGGLRSAQIVAWLILAITLAGLEMLKRKSSQNG